MICVDCQTANVHEFLSMHCWECFNKRFTEKEQDRILVGDMSEQLESKCDEKDCKHEVWE